MKKVLLFLLVNLTLYNGYSMNEFYNFSFTKADNSTLNLSEFKDKAVMVVNTASHCGFTNQYKDLEQLYQKFKDRGFVILAVPSNDFGNQEPGDMCSIEDFVGKKFSITFPLLAKESVKGEKAHPFFIWAAKEVGIIGSAKWNFHKYLIDKNGNLVDWFSSITSPMSDKVIQSIEKHLN